MPRSLRSSISGSRKICRISRNRARGASGSGAAIIAAGNWDINLFKTRIAEALEGRVLASSIRDAKFITQSAWERESVYTHKLGSGVGKDFFRLAEELVELIGI